MMHFYVNEKELDNVRSHDLNYIFICILIKKFFKLAKLLVKIATTTLLSINAVTMTSYL